MPQQLLCVLKLLFYPLVPSLCSYNNPHPVAEDYAKESPVMPPTCSSQILAFLCVCSYNNPHPAAEDHAKEPQVTPHLQIMLYYYSTSIPLVPVVCSYNNPHPVAEDYAKEPPVMPPHLQIMLY
jgi:hypothetical protein